MKGNLQSAETEEVTWMSDKTFVQLKTLRPDEQNQTVGAHKNMIGYKSSEMYFFTLDPQQESSQQTSSVQ